MMILILFLHSCCAIKYRGGEQIAEFETVDQTWVTSLAWSRNGNLAFCSHLSYVYVVINPLGGQGSGSISVVVKLDGLAFSNSTVFVDDTTLFCGGHDGFVARVEYFPTSANSSGRAGGVADHHQQLWQEDKTLWKITSRSAISNNDQQQTQQQEQRQQRMPWKLKGKVVSNHNISSRRQDETINSIKLVRRNKSTTGDGPASGTSTATSIAAEVRCDDEPCDLFVSAVGSSGLFSIYVP